MKKLFLSSFFLLALTSAIFAQDKKISDVAKFETDTVNLGKMKQGVPTKGTFVVTNISNSPLIIEQANPTCGCTISDYTKEPILPGKTGVINATYNASGNGNIEKHLTVKFAGINDMKTIALKGEVLPAADYDKWKAEEDAKTAAAAAEKAKQDASKKTTVKKTKKKKKTTTTTATTTAKTK